MMMSFAALPILPSAVKRTSPPLMPTSPVKVLAALVISNRPSVFALAAKVIPPDPVLEIIALKVFAPLFPWVKIRLIAPRETLLAKERLAVLLARATIVASSPNCTFPPIVIPPPKRVLAKLRLSFDASVPPFNTKVLPVPLPNPVVPRAITVPAFRVKEPSVAPPAPVAKTPAPFFIKPLPAVVPNAFEFKSKSEPAPISKVRTAPPVPHVPLIAEKVTLVLAAKVTFPTLPVPPPVNT